MSRSLSKWVSLPSFAALSTLQTLAGSDRPGSTEESSPPLLYSASNPSSFRSPPPLHQERSIAPTPSATLESDGLLGDLFTLPPRHRQPVSRHSRHRPHTVLIQIIQIEMNPSSRDHLLAELPGHPLEGAELDERTLPPGFKTGLPYIPSIPAQRSQLRQAGFTEDEIREYLGIPTTSEEVLDAIQQLAYQQQQERQQDDPTDWARHAALGLPQPKK